MNRVNCLGLSHCKYHQCNDSTFGIEVRLRERVEHGVVENNSPTHHPTFTEQEGTWQVPYENPSPRDSALNFWGGMMYAESFVNHRVDEAPTGSSRAGFDANKTQRLISYPCNKPKAHRT